MSRGFRITVAVVLLIGMLALPPLVPKWTTGATVVMVALELLCLQALLAAVCTGRVQMLFLRTAAASVFLAFAAYLVAELVKSGGKLTGGRRSQASALSALVGLVIVGWPCVRFAVCGPRKEEDTTAAELDDGDEDLDEDGAPPPPRL